MGRKTTVYPDGNDDSNSTSRGEKASGKTRKGATVAPVTGQPAQSAWGDDKDNKDDFDVINKERDDDNDGKTSTAAYPALVPGLSAQKKKGKKKRTSDDSASQIAEKKEGLWERKFWSALLLFFRYFFAPAIISAPFVVAYTVLSDNISRLFENASPEAKDLREESGKVKGGDVQKNLKEEIAKAEAEGDTQRAATAEEALKLDEDVKEARQIRNGAAVGGVVAAPIWAHSMYHKNGIIRSRIEEQKVKSSSDEYIEHRKEQKIKRQKEKELQKKEVERMKEEREKEAVEAKKWAGLISDILDTAVQNRLKTAAGLIVKEHEGVPLREGEKKYLRETAPDTRILNICLLYNTNSMQNYKDFIAKSKIEGSMEYRYNKIPEKERKKYLDGESGARSL